MPLRIVLLFSLAILLQTTSALAVPLPRALAPLAPFPTIVSQAPTVQSVAPGVTYGAYTLQTAQGPLAIHIVAIAPGRSDVHIGALLAHNVLESKGQSVVSMAQRSGAVAGINGDYFDIGNTGRPTNIVVQNGTLLQTPRKRYAFFVSTSGVASIAEVTFLGQLQLPGKVVALDAIDTTSADGGVALYTPAYGSVAPAQNSTLLSLTPTDGTPPFATYRVDGILDNLQTQPPGYYLAIGLNAYGTVGVPAIGETIAATGDLSPIPLASIATAIGGGPLILQNGAWFADPDGPGGPAFSAQIPCSGAAIAPDGTLFLIEVDGRQPLESVGITRPAFAALMQSLGATTGMAFDGGGSSSIAVRLLGENEATMQGSPSDGRPRRVADGVFVYSSAPSGPPTRIVTQPGVLRMLPGSSASLRAATIDSGDHAVAPPSPITVNVVPSNLARYNDGALTALRPGSGVLRLRSGALVANVPLAVDAQPARIAISPPSPNLSRGASLQLSAAAFDAHGFPLQLPSDLTWSASSGTIDRGGLFHAGERNAIVGVRIANREYTTLVTVGSHDVPLDFATKASFLTLPRDGAGSLEPDPSCAGCIQLTYALGPSERAAYAYANLTLPQRTIAIAFDVRDDGGGALLKIALRSAANQQVLLVATRLNTPGWRHVTVRVPATLDRGTRLVAIYTVVPGAVRPLGGSIVLRNVQAVVAGSGR